MILRFAFLISISSFYFPTKKERLCEEKVWKFEQDSVLRILNSCCQGYAKRSVKINYITNRFLLCHQHYEDSVKQLHLFLSEYCNILEKYYGELLTHPPNDEKSNLLEAYLEIKKLNNNNEVSLEDLIYIGIDYMHATKVAIKSSQLERMDDFLHEAKFSLNSYINKAISISNHIDKYVPSTLLNSLSKEKNFILVEYKIHRKEHQMVLYIHKQSENLKTDGDRHFEIYKSY